ncbi:MAG: holo-ACP synthase [Microthrixaceae bacterium]|nr:holo-ACP synthase [Actinomycetota bacterium]
MIPVAVGTDVVEVDRIRRALDRTPTLEARVFTSDEIAYCRAAREPWQRFAARWAAKEAVIKCLGGGLPGLDPHGIEVAHLADGAPTVRLSGDVRRRAEERGIERWLVSLSHERTVATATAIALAAM